MRVKLVFEDPLPPYRCWYEIPSSCSTIRDLQRSIRKGFELNQFCKTTRLDLDGFFLLPSSTVAGSVRDGDLLQVMIRKKDDNLPPRSLPAAGGKKRSRESAESPQEASKNSKRMKTNPPKQAPALNGQSRASTKPGAGHQGNKPNNTNAQKNKNNPTKPQVKKSSQDLNANKRKQKQQNAGPSQNKTRPKSATTITPPQSGIAKSTTSKQVNSSTRKGKVVPPKKSNPTKTPSTSSSSTDSSESSSSSSDSSSSDDSSTSDSDSDNDDSSDSSNSVDSSDSDSEANPKSSAIPAAKVPFGCGSSGTKARNMRRKRSALAKAQLMETTSAQTQEQDQEKGTRAVESQSSPPIISTISTKKISPQSAPNVFMTTVELKDSELMSKASKSTPSKRVTRSSQKAAASNQPKDTTIGPNPSPTIARKEAAPGIEANEDQVEDKPTPPRNYEELPKLEGHPKVGDLIAYKTLEMGPSYTPIISDFKEATITSFSETDMVAEAQLSHKFRVQFEVDSDGNTILGKFDIYDETEIDLAKRGIVSLDMLSLADCRIISRK
ncbi:hypothetical protein BGZ80_011580 [Entomortierella chlamydospora]|uniref:Coilin n=1 Tax=Entomortierella chlamydospora TaxID=101097 RepID=A0A9P6N2M5_9FUNG|nr:hypothetical protein BGZ79_000086 [Entomortierella chlamydospora]KAG0022635.1 hypothetical protein BGZ80_011580 [Entomortierella chlamydospora]